MAIAVIGWGSLIWCPGSLRIRSRWHVDGPALPIEFARISSDGRLTLVIHPGRPDQDTYWAISQFEDIDEAIRDLARRERIDDLAKIGRLDAGEERSSDTVRSRIADWLGQHPEVGSAIWTALKTNWTRKRQRPFSVEDALAYLSEVESKRDEADSALKRAREYVQNTPPQIQTEVRKQAAERGWTDAPLASSLFE